MKRKATTLFALLGLVAMPFIGVNAQTGVNANGEMDNGDIYHAHTSTLFPKAGDIGIIVDATPAINFMGNILNVNTSGSPYQLQEFWETQKFTLGVRYFLLDNLALRGFLTFNPEGRASSTTTNYLVQDDVAVKKDPKSTAKVMDTHTSYNNAYQMRFGAQFYRGQNKLRGFYGGDISYGFARTSDSYTYGNAMTSSNLTPTSTSFAGTGSGPAPLSSRPLSSDPAFQHTVGLMGFGGVEYYFTPQICIGFEAGLLFQATFTPTGMAVTEFEKDGKPAIKEEEIIGFADENRIFFNTQNPFNGSLYVTFHF